MVGTRHLRYGARYVRTGIDIEPVKEPHFTWRKINVKNADVLDALQEITGQDLGYNKRAWAAWWQSQSGY